MLNDLRFALRKLRRQPGHTALAVAVLALGLGAATATFSLVNAAVLRPLPFPEPHQLVRVNEVVGHRNNYMVSSAHFLAYRAENAVLDGMAAVDMRQTSVAEVGQPPEAAWALYVSADFFPLLRVRPQLGRAFFPEEDQPGRNRVVVLSHRIWQDRFGGDHGIVGRSLRVGEETVTVVGVMPATFFDPLRRWTRVELWRPMALGPRVLGSGGNRELEVVARLEPGVSLGEAQAHLSTVAARLDTTTPRRMRLKPLGAKAGLSGDSEAAIWLTLGLAIFVLLLACVNLAGIQLARLAGHAHERAIRLALGAGLARLVREGVAESLLVSVAGGGLGILLASWATELVGRRLVIGGNQVTVGLPVELDGRVLAFAGALVLTSALVVGTVPAWLGRREAVIDGLRKGGPGTPDRSSSSPRLRQALVVAEMAMALVLLAGGGLFLRGLQRFVAADPGWNVEGLLTGRINLPGTRYPTYGARAAGLQRLEERLASLPGAEHAALASNVPITRGGRSELVVEGAPPAAPGLAPTHYDNCVSPAYFATLGIALREGRLFTAGDGSENLAVAVINETMARDLWPGRSPLGKRITFAEGDATSATYWKTIVGVVADVRYRGDLEDPKSRFQVYYPLRQAVPGRVYVVLRARGDPEALAPALRRAVAEVDADLLVYELLGARTLMDRQLTNFRLAAWVTFAFAGLGLLLSALGVYGLFAGFVAERTREIGVRMALGARAGQVLGLVLRKGLRLAAAGALLGALGALALFPVLRAVAYELPAPEPTALVALPLLLIAVALLACWLPARRAAALEPMVALRQE
jgi:putative ABC transport system permease protein